jgi:hypothetical protein
MGEVRRRRMCRGRCVGGVDAGWVFIMKLVSWNVRGFRGAEKRKEVRQLIGEKCPFIIYLQETKLGVCEESLCLSMWGHLNVAFFYRPSVGASGGLLTMWDTDEVEVWSSVSRDYVLSF